MILAHAAAVTPVERAQVVVRVVAIHRAVARFVSLNAVAGLSGDRAALVVDAISHHAWPLWRTHKHLVVTARASTIDRHAWITIVDRVHAALAVLLAARSDAIRMPWRGNDSEESTANNKGTAH